MEITEVRIKLIESAEDRLRGFCSVTFDDCFVVRDLKIIEGNNGPFVAMPSRKLTSNCYKCRTKNHLRASFCNHCGSQLKSDHIEHDSGGRAKLYADIAHPVNARCREMIQKRVIKELNHETQLASKPGYRSRYDEDFNEETVAEPLYGDTTQDKTNPPTGGLRQDHGTDIPPTPHNQGINTEQEASDTASGEFGKGIFD
ncbi:SpoVG family protein [Mariniblastus sp.]|nr:SpoVG family protein [Mariniblastus sp.]